MQGRNHRGSFHRNTWGVLAGASLIATGLSGCNGDNDSGGPALPTSTPTPTGPTATATPTGPTATATPIGNRFAASYTGTYRSVEPPTGEVGTVSFVTSRNGQITGSFSSPFLPAPVPVTGTVTDAGRLQATANAQGNTGILSITINASLNTAKGLRGGSGTFVSNTSEGAVRGTVVVSENRSTSAFVGNYTGTYTDSTTGPVTLRIDNNGIVTASIQSPVAGAIQTRGIADLTTGQITATGSFSAQGTSQFIGLSGRLSGRNGVISGGGELITNEGPTGRFTIRKTS